MKYKTPEEFKAVADEYYKECFRKRKIKNFIGFCAFAKISEQTFYNYMERPGYADVCRDVRNECADTLIQEGFKNPKSGNFAAFLLRCMHNMNEKTESKITINTNAQTVADLINAYSDKTPAKIEETTKDE